MRYFSAVVLGVILSLRLVAGAVASQTCTEQVQSVLETLDEICATTGRNQACYGNAEVLAQSRAGVANFTFETPGDIVDAVWIESMQLSPLDATTNYWGVSLMRLQANLPDTLPGQNVTFLLFGDVEVTNAVPVPDTVSQHYSLPTNLVVRVGPSMNSPVLTYLESGSTVSADGRLADSSWLRLADPLGNGTSGWVYAPLITTEDVSQLEVIDPAVIEPELSPMQAIYLKTGTGDMTCGEVPQDGVLVQTPHGQGRINLQINGVNLELGSTVYFRTGPDNSLQVSTIEGLAAVEAMGQVQYAFPGTTVSVPLTPDLEPAGPPVPPEPYVESVMRELPVEPLDRPVTVYQSLSEERIEEAEEQIRQGRPVCGAPPLARCASNGRGNGNGSGNGNGNGRGNGNGNGNANGNANGNSNGSGNGNSNGNGNGNRGG